ncbi:MAG: SGNH/GDSL hydrolase family protein [Chlamydiia bacterium]|nr:SGNH/GDSL hydrolase family protein [Chlamydiia bacterium]
MEPVKTFVHLLGDSTLDNVYWLIGNDSSSIPSAQEGCVKGQLATQLGEHYQVEDESYDGFTTTNVLDGGSVGEVLCYNRLYLTARLGQNQSMFVKPLERLREKVSKSPGATHYVVISVGGNDFRVLLLQPWKLLAEIPHVQERYLEIVRQIQSIEGNVRPIFMFQYRTDVRSRPYFICTILGVLGYIAATINTLAIGTLFYSAYQLTKNRVSIAVGIGKMFVAAAFLYLSHRQLSLRVTKEIFMGKQAGLAVFGASMERLYQPMIKKAKEDNIPILDLPNLFNPMDPTFYKCEIEPSREGGRFIAEQLAGIIKRYDSRVPTATTFENWRVKAL